MPLSPTWNYKRVRVLYRNSLTGNMEAGTWAAVSTGRITNTLADGSRQVFRAGRIGSGNLNTIEGQPSLVVDLPIVDDPDNMPQGGEIVLTITFTASGESEVFHLSPLLSWPDGVGTDLALILDPTFVPAAPPFAIKGVPGGVAALDADGDVVDSDGVKVIAGGTGGGSTATWSTISGKPTVIAAGTDAAAARAAISAASTDQLTAKADLVGGVVPVAQIPAIAVTDFLGSVSGQSAMLALGGQKGDWCIRTDLGTNWVITGSTPTALSSWTQYSYPASPTKASLGLGSVDNTSDAAKPVSTAQANALASKTNQSNWQSGSRTWSPARNASAPEGWVFSATNFLRSQIDDPNDANGGAGRKGGDILEVRKP